MLNPASATPPNNTNILSQYYTVYNSTSNPIPKTVTPPQQSDSFNKQNQSEEPKDKNSTKKSGTLGTKLNISV